MGAVHILDLHFSGLEKTIAAFLVETEKGPVLIETGPHSTILQLENEVNRCGYALSEVKHVFVTHIHFDHAGAAWVLAKHGATIYVHPNGVRHLVDPSKLYESAKRIYKDQMETLWGDFQPISPNQINGFDHEQTVKIGNQQFKALQTPGHATHHIAWQVGVEIFTGDVGGIKIGDGIPMPPCPPPDIQIEDWLNSIDLILMQIPEALYLTHFGKVTEVEAHLIQLRERLLDWANWMKPFVLERADEQIVIEKFSNYVAGQLREAGVSGEDLQRYESANPAFMSVGGLSRYWRKKFEQI